jgi:tetratricopeptide (TPR) repeat protein
LSGNATFSGTNYQASVIAYVLVHVLTETKLRWLSPVDDTPIAVSGEVRGPGDDARVEFRSGVPVIELQAKHGLKPQKCVDAFGAIRDGSQAGETSTVLLVVDSTSSPSIRNDLKRDLERLRSGRTDALKDITREVMTELAAQAAAIVARVQILIGLAKTLAADISKTDRTLTSYERISLARIAVLQEDFDRAEQFYRQVAADDALHRSELLAELGSRYLLAGRPKDAIRIFRDGQPLPKGAARPFVRALVEANELADAHAELERLAAAGPMPDWAVAFAAQIALRSNDPKVAAAHLEDLFARGAMTPDGRLTLTKTLLELEQRDRACFHAEALIAETGLSARQRMFLAQLLGNLGQTRRAIHVGIDAFREDPTYALLGAYYVDPPTAARVVVGAVKMNALRHVRITTTAFKSGLEGMVTRIPPLIAARLIYQAAERELELLPMELLIVTQTCMRFAKAQGLPTVGPGPEPQ